MRISFMNKTLEKRMSKLLLSDDKDLFPILMLFNGAIAARNRYDLFCFSTFFFTGDESKKDVFWAHFATNKKINIQVRFDEDEESGGELFYVLEVINNDN